MRKMILAFLIVGLFCVTACPVCESGEEDYFNQLGRTFVRGVKNVLTFPCEIPLTVQEHDAQDDGNPRIFRDTAGFFDGTFRALTRFGCGAWDILWSVVPGEQEGLPLEPETFL